MSKFKNFAKTILLAQVASDAGKGYLSAKETSNASKAIEMDYSLKDRYIKEAISLAAGISSVKVGIDIDEELGMTVVLFEVKGYGQISFHSFDGFFTQRKLLKDSIIWNGIRGGSVKTCMKLARKLNLQHYMKKGYNM